METGESLRGHITQLPHCTAMEWSLGRLGRYVRPRGEGRSWIRTLAFCGIALVHGLEEPENGTWPSAPCGQVREDRSGIKTLGSETTNQSSRPNGAQIPSNALSRTHPVSSVWPLQIPSQTQHLWYSYSLWDLCAALLMRETVKGCYPKTCSYVVEWMGCEPRPSDSWSVILIANNRK